MKIIKCEGILCALRHHCRRFTERPNPEFQQWNDFWRRVQRSTEGLFLRCRWFILDQPRTNDE